jgi:DNA-binding response OmpR family regulator
MKVLIVDDDILLCATLARSLIRLGHSSRTATSVESGLTLIESETPSAVLTDLELGPAGNGVEFISRLRQRGSTVPVIMMTGSDPEMARARLDEAGLDVVAILEKPFPFEELMAKLISLFPQAAAAPAPGGAPKTSMAAMMERVVRTLGGRGM